MRVLLDTHTFLWAVGEPARLSRKVTQFLTADDTQAFLSAASLWEIALKVRAGKLRLPETAEFFVEHMAALGVQPLAVEVSHVLLVLGLPDHHRDPFDRLLIAQSQAEHLPIVTSDPAIRRYSVEVLW